MSRKTICHLLECSALHEQFVFKIITPPTVPACPAPHTMESAEFRSRGREMVDLITDYLDTIATRRPLPDVTPGYLRELIPDHAPGEGEAWEAVKADIERVIMPGVSGGQGGCYAGVSGVKVVM